MTERQTEKGGAKGAEKPTGRKTQVSPFCFHGDFDSFFPCSPFFLWFSGGKERESERERERERDLLKQTNRPAGRQTLTRKLRLINGQTERLMNT